jgi:hypothetical protein
MADTTEKNATAEKVEKEIKASSCGCGCGCVSPTKEKK